MCGAVEGIFSILLRFFYHGRICFAVLQSRQETDVTEIGYANPNTV